jgi:predicted alpha-1,2-mannosidase
MILSAYQNGFKGFNAEEALNAMVETSTTSHINSNWEMYTKFGYYPFDLLDNESVSRTLESGYDDWCVAAMAGKLGQEIIKNDFQNRANFYRNIYDSSTTFFRGKDMQGNWRTPFDPLMATSPLNNPGDYTEANAWQYFWTPAQHDVPGMMQLLGGKEQFTQKLNAFFTTEALHPNKFLGQEAMIGQYAHGNEPSHHIIYLYAFTDQFKTGQKYIHQVMTDFHQNTPNGMIGNDDCGQMSAWYILSSLGFYPVNPAEGTFVIGSPQVNKAVLHLGPQKRFVIKAQHLSEANIYQENPTLNKQVLDKPIIRYTDIMSGGVMKFRMQNH